MTSDTVEKTKRPWKIELAVKTNLQKKTWRENNKYRTKEQNTRYREKEKVTPM